MPSPRGQRKFADGKEPLVAVELVYEDQKMLADEKALPVAIVNFLRSQGRIRRLADEKKPLVAV